MATAPATPITNKRRREMGQELTAPEQFTFTKQGQEAEGVLLSIEPVMVKGKQAIEYLFQTDGGGRFTCLGTADLDKKISPNHIGYFLHIRYERDDNSFTKPGQNAMKIFKITPAKEKEPGF
jgi:hypothetical protein